MNRIHAIRCCSMLLLAQLCAPASIAQIFTCIDTSGRKITSDRPIAECRDKDQKELNASGTVKRVVKPSMTAEEQRVAEQKLKDEAEEKARAEEERRKNRALLSRYPNKTAHDKERATALAQVDEVIQAAQKRIGELADQRKKISEELEFYKKDPSKAPAPLRRLIEENEKSVAVQKRFIGDQDDEKKRANVRFDEELTRLKKLWAQTSVPASPASAAPSTASSTTPSRSIKK
jgi:DNA repair exonuclease SbcCD ATPase subunit